MKKKVFIQTFGCQMNVHDSEQIAALLGRFGYEWSPDAASADLVLVNTCSIREKAAQKAMSQLGRFRSLKKNRPETLIGVCGCLAQQRADGLLRQAPHIDFVLGTHNIHRLQDILEHIGATGKKVVETSFHDEIPSLSIVAPPDQQTTCAFVTIMQGCNNRCAYCVVPFLRGRETSRPCEEIVAEIQTLVKAGIREVTLLGQNVNSYGQTLSPQSSFPELLRSIGTIDGLKRVRFTTSHPKDISDDLIGCFREIPVLCEHIHLPVQSGSDRVLDLMNRGYSRSDYLRRVEKLRSACPEIALSSDIIVGFPGEREEDFRQTLDLIDKIGFDNLFSFKYSRREGTAALFFPDQVSDQEKKERLRRLQARQEEFTLANNRKQEGSLVEVLVEGRSRNTSEDMTGRTRTNRIVNFRGGADLVGDMVCVHIQRAYLHSLRGDLQG